MESLLKIREINSISQRRLAAIAGISYKTLQLVEGGGHDVRLTTLTQIARALGYSPHYVEKSIDHIFTTPPNSVFPTSENILREGKDSWRIYLFNFVDAFRKKRDPSYITEPPSERSYTKMKALLASTVETLCLELEINIPWWCSAVTTLQEPWFVAGIENLKAASLVESPVHFRKRNIFVLANFLERR